MTLKKATALVEQALEAYRALLRDDPAHDEASRRQQEAADLLVQAQAEGMGQRDNDAFIQKFQEANGEIERLEAMRIGGYEEEEPEGVDEEEPEDIDVPDEPESDYESARAYASMAEPADAD